MKGFLLGYDIGGTKCALVLGRAASSGVDIIVRHEFATPPGPQATLKRYESDTFKLLAVRNLALRDIAAIGISCGGPLDPHKGIVQSPPNLPGWDNVPIADYFKKTFSLPVSLQNDANACALAEWQWGAGKGAQNMVFLTFGTGMGAGLILDGRLYSGTNGLAGEVGHVRLAESGPMGYGKEGSFEAFCSGGGIAGLARQTVESYRSKGVKVAFAKNKKEAAALTAKTVFEWAGKGDPMAGEMVKLSAKYLGRGLAVLMDTLNPEVIVIGGIFGRQKDQLWPKAFDEIMREALPQTRKACRVVPAGLGEQVGDYAALAVAEYQVKGVRSKE